MVLQASAAHSALVHLNSTCMARCCLNTTLQAWYGCRQYLVIYHVQSKLRRIVVALQVHGVLLSTKDKKICAVLSQDGDQAEQENIGAREGTRVAEVQALYQLSAG